MMVLKKNICFFLSISVLIFFLSCNNAHNPWGNDGPATEVTFTISSNTASRNIASRAVAAPNKALCVNANWYYNDPLTVYVLDISEGLNSFMMPKGGLYYISFLSSFNSSEISSFGNLSIPALDLDSLPLAVDAADEYDLGILTIESGSVNSALSTTSCVSGSGYTESILDTLGGYDAVALKFLNPDINGNNIIDAEEDLHWLFWARYYLPVNYEYVSDTGTSLVDGFDENLDLTAEFESNPAYYHNLFIELPASAGNIADNSDLSLSCSESAGGTKLFRAEKIGEEEGTVKVACYWDGAGIGPFDGDYTLNAGDLEFNFRSLAFVSPANSISGLILPLPHLQENGSGSIEGLRWRWINYVDGRYMELPREAAELILGNKEMVQINLSFSEPQNGCISKRWFLREERTDYEEFAADGSLLVNGQLAVQDFYTGSVSFPAISLNKIRSVGFVIMDMAGNEYEYEFIM